MPADTRPVRRLLRTIATAAGLIAHAAPLRAQALRVRAIGEATGAPLGGAIADVLDARDAVAAQALLDPAGRRLLPLPGPGTYRVRVRRIGYEPFVSAPLAVAGADTLDLPLRVPERRIALGTIRVTDRRRCAGDAYAAGSAVATLLEEARKAFTATVLSRGELAGELVIEGRTFVRHLDEDRRPLELRLGFPRRVGGRPFVSVSAAELSDSGYVRWGEDGTTFHGPDEQVLASGEFVRDHCFEVVGGRGATAGLFGVRFTPARRRASDIAGVLWIDSTSAELQHLDFWYEDPRLPVVAHGQDRSGGQVVFGRVPTGHWIVTAWRLRMPRISRDGVTLRTHVVDYTEEGGIVTPDPAWGTDTVAAQRPYLDMLRPARVAGTVYDSLAWRPLAGARVRITPIVTDDLPTAVGPELVTHTAFDTTDAEGRYAFDSLPAGPYRLEFNHPALDPLRILLPSRDLLLAPGAAVEGALAVPSWPTLARGCVRDGPVREGGLLLGTVRWAGGRGVPDATLRVTWADPSRGGSLFTLSLSTAPDGGWRVCGVPVEGTVIVRAVPPGGARPGAEASVTFGARRVARVDLVLPVTDR
jgi:hypothetical protein